MTETRRLGDNSEEHTSDERESDAVFESKRAETQRWVETLLGLGFVWNPGVKNELIHPNDPELTAWRDPYAEELFFSPKLKDQIAEVVRRTKAIPLGIADTLSQ
jgi:hypothetical protein